MSDKLLFIEQCPDPMMWYSDKVGETVPFVREETQCYWSREDEGFINRVEKEDAKIVESDQNQANDIEDKPSTPNLDRMEDLPIGELIQFLEWLRNEYSICEYVDPDEMDDPPPFKLYNWFEIEGENMTFNEARNWVAENVDNASNSFISVSENEVREHATVHTGTGEEFVEATGSEPNRGLLSTEEFINPGYPSKGFHPIREGNQSLIYEFFDLDAQEIEEERRKVLSQLSLQSDG